MVCDQWQSAGLLCMWQNLYVAEPLCVALPVITSFEHPICCPDAVLNCTGTVLSRCTSLESSCLTTSLKENRTMAYESAFQTLDALLACLLTDRFAACQFVRLPFVQWCTWTFSVKQMLLAACSWASQPFTTPSNKLDLVRHSV